MKTIITNLLTLLVSISALGAIAPGDYYIQNDFYNKVLALDDAGGIYLMPYDSDNDANFVFEAVAGSGNYVKLRHKATGKYLAASTSNTYSVLMTDDGDGDEYMWALDAKFSTSIVSKKSSGKRLGCDYNTGTNVPIYYDKSQGGLNWFSIVPANGSGFTASRKAHQTESFTNEYGVQERDAYCVSSSVSVSGEDFHIISAEPFDGGSVNLSGDRAWLVFENVRPSKVISNYLSNVTINGAAASDGVNCRVEIWLTGAVVIPCSPSDTPFVGYSASGSRALALGNHTSLDTFNNEMTSFTLKRGYMATIATGQEGNGYSRVYVADHADLSITLPKALERRVSSVYVRNWHYTSKRGYASGDENHNLACNSSWKWNWDANLSSSRDIEYIPIKQHRYWPADDNFNKPGSTAMMLINEPEHSEQHSSCSCGGALDEWTCYTITPKYNSTGLRIGSPSATDLNWLKNYTKHCDDMAQRCDIVCTHGYWSSNWANNINTLWNNSQRPIWITEWEYGSSWDSYQPANEAEYAKHVLDVLDILEYDNRVERYSYYGVDGGGGTGWMRWLFYEKNPSNGLTHAGRVYKNVKTHFAYDSSRQAVPNWWEPSVSAPQITSFSVLPNGSYTLEILNNNGDTSASITIEMKDESGAWTTLKTISQRSELDATTFALELAEGSLPETCSLRATVETIYGKRAQSDEYAIDMYVETHEYMKHSFDEGNFTTQGIVTYQKDVTSACPLYNMQPIDGWTIPENGDARAAALMTWGTAGLGGTDYAMPATDSNGSATGGGIGLVAVWTAQAQYTCDITLPAGNYKLIVPVYNVGKGTDIDKNLVGFVASDNTEYLSERTSYPVGQWTIEVITLSLTKPTKGYLTLGYKAKNVGSGSSPHLAYDYIAIMGGPKTMPTYTVTYYDGETVLQQFDVELGTAIPTFTPDDKEGYTFTGWSGDTYDAMPAQDITYIANYEPNTYTVTYYDGETVVQQFEVKYGEAVPTFTPDDKEGYTFTSWNGDTYDAMPAQNITYIANYEPNTYTVTYYDGQTVVQQFEVKYGEAVPTFTPDDKEGYTFTGWSGDTYDAMPAQDITYIANYEPNTYTVTYYDGDTVLQQFEVKYGDPIPTYTYEKEGYTFDGWIGYTYDAMPAQDISFYAITTPTSIHGITSDATFSIHTTTGVCVKRNATAADLQTLPNGMFILLNNGRTTTVLIHK